MAFAATILASCGSKAVVCEVSEVTIGDKATRDSFRIHGTKSCEVLFAPEWLFVSTNENAVYYSVGANISDEPRESYLILKCSGEQIVLPVIQGAKPSYLIVSKNKLTMNHDGDTAQVALLTNGGVVTIKSSIPQLKVTRDGNYITIVSEKNEGKQKVGTIKITTGKISKTITVTIPAAPKPEQI